ncbi:hypothetical protein D3C76_1353350 [compost metagenome]
MFGGLDDRRANPVSHGRADLRSTVDNDHADVLLISEHGTQACRHFSAGLNTGKTAAHDHHGIAGNALGPILERFQVILKAHGRLDLVNVEGIGLKPLNLRAGQLTAGRNHQAVVAQRALTASLIAVGNGPCLFVDALSRTFDKAHPH